MNCRGARDPSAADLPEVPRTSSPSSAPTSWAGAIFSPALPTRPRRPASWAQRA